MPQLSKTVIVALAILLTVSYGLSLAASGVSIPGLIQWIPLDSKSGEGAP